MSKGSPEQAGRGDRRVLERAQQMGAGRCERVPDALLAVPHQLPHEGLAGGLEKTPQRCCQLNFRDEGCLQGSRRPDWA